MEAGRRYIGVSKERITSDTTTLEFVPIIREPFDMSYPSVFKHKERWYMIPETWKDYNIILYTATRFPFEWKRLKNIVPGYPGAGTTHFAINNAWYLFTRHEKTKQNMFFTTKQFPEGEFYPIKENPFPRGYRGGGSALYINNKVIIPVQHPSCGRRGYGCEIELWEVTPELNTRKIQTLQPKKESADGLHHISYDASTKLFMVDLRDAKHSTLDAPAGVRIQKVGSAYKLSYVVKNKQFTYYNLSATAVTSLKNMDWGKQTRIMNDLVELLQAFSQACVAHGVQWWLIGGSPLGWARNRALIPWDDDLDVCLKKSDEHKLVTEVGSTLFKIDPNLTLVYCYGRLIKLVRKPYCYPWIDVFFKSREAGDIWSPRHAAPPNSKPGSGDLHSVQKESVPDDKLFPLQEICFHGVQAYLARDVTYGVQRQYGKAAVSTYTVHGRHRDERVCRRKDCLTLK